MKCPKCQSENPEESRFCLECGARIEIRCPECGKPLPLRAKFCNECGHGLIRPTEAPPIDYTQPQSYTPKFLADKILTTRSSIEGERKLVTVLFADVADYTSIAEKLDPEEVHQIMDGCFKILMDEIHRYEGTINQFTGDGVMALFGAPVAHEDHGQRACHAALAIQKAIEGYGEKIKGQHGAEFKLRIGLNSGPVIVGSIGDDLRMDYTAVGDTTNLAHRMQDMAEPGAVLVSGHTHRLARDFFEFEPLGKVEVKGKEKPQEAYELVRPTKVETRIEAAAAKGLTRFVGRRKEMENLREAFDKAKSGSGQVMGIVGEAGVGKSRLLLELRGMLPEGDYSFLEGRCLHYGGSMPYLPILDVLKAYFDIREGDLESRIRKKVRECMCKLDANLLDVPACLHEVMSLTVDDEKYLQLGPQQRRERTFEAIRDLLICESQVKPLVLAVEDLHWIDKTSEEFLDYLIGFLPTARILLILLYRPEYTHTWGSKSYYGKVGLDQLSAQTSAELVQAILEGGKVAPEIAGLVLGRAGGNPLFVEELTHSLVENGSIQKKDHQFVLTRKPSEIEVPDTIQGIIAARMDRIEDNLKRIMQVASVIGREFAYRILQSITDMSEDLKASLVNLQGLEFIYEKQLFPELEYIFKHALTQEVAYNSLLVKRRKEIHEKIGQAIEEIYAERLEEYYELLAYHYVRSDNKQKAVEYFDLANQKAIRVSSMDEAMAYFDEAMKLLDALDETDDNLERRISLLANQSFVFVLLFRAPELVNLLTRYESVAVRVGDPGLLGRFYHCLGHCEMTIGSLDKAIKTLNKAAELCETAGNAEDAGFAYMSLQWSHLFRGDYGRVLALKEDALRDMGERLLLYRRVRVLLACTWALSHLGRWDEALEEGQKALSVAQKFSDNSQISAAASFTTLSYVLKGDLGHAVRYGELAVEKASTPAEKAWAQGVFGAACCSLGDPEEGIKVVASLVAIFRAGRQMPATLPAMFFLGEGYRRAGQHAKGRQTLEELLNFAERCGARGYLGSAHRLLGEIALKTNADEAAPHFEKAITIFRALKMENELALAYSGMGRYHKQQGNVKEAREYLTKALEIFERLGTLIEPDKVREELAGLR
jgi:class 3 adenylate cyclase/tetratricopeptide (TPR) repeat protein